MCIQILVSNVLLIFNLNTYIGMKERRIGSCLQSLVSLKTEIIDDSYKIAAMYTLLTL